MPGWGVELGVLGQEKFATTRFICRQVILKSRLTCWGVGGRGVEKFAGMGALPPTSQNLKYPAFHSTSLSFLDAVHLQMLLRRTQNNFAGDIGLPKSSVKLYLGVHEGDNITVTVGPFEAPF
jgi:hypothetical protein